MLETYLDRIYENILNPVIVLLFSVALLYFVYGIFKFISNSDNPEQLKEAKKTVMWGIVGMVIMTGVYGIKEIIESVIGL